MCTYFHFFHLICTERNCLFTSTNNPDEHFPMYESLSTTGNYLKVNLFHRVWTCNNSHNTSGMLPAQEKSLSEKTKTKSVLACLFVKVCHGFWHLSFVAAFLSAIAMLDFYLCSLSLRFLCRWFALFVIIVLCFPRVCIYGSAVAISWLQLRYSFVWRCGFAVVLDLYVL